MSSESDPEFTARAPRVVPDLPQLEVDGHLIVGHEAVGGSLLLDPVFAVLFRSLDAQVTLGDLAADLAAIDDVSTDRSRWIVETFVDGLRLEGFLDPAPNDRSPRRVFAPIPHDSCVGRLIGLGKAEMVQVLGCGQGLRLGSTAPGVLGPIAEYFTTETVDETSFYETIVLRATGSRTSRRVQRVVDSSGGLLYEGRSHDTAVEAFQRTVSGRIDLVNGGAWIEGPVLEGADRVVLVHPSLKREAIHDRAAELESLGFRCLPGALNRILPGGRLEVCGNRFGEGAARVLPVTGALLPAFADRPQAARLMLDLCRNWDDQHFAALAELLPALRPVSVEGGAPEVPWATAIGLAAEGP